MRVWNAFGPVGAFATVPIGGPPRRGPTRFLISPITALRPVGSPVPPLATLRPVRPSISPLTTLRPVWSAFPALAVLTPLWPIVGSAFSTVGLLPTLLFDLTRVVIVPTGSRWRVFGVDPRRLRFVLESGRLRLIFDPRRFPALRWMLGPFAVTFRVALFIPWSERPFEFGTYIPSSILLTLLIQLTVALGIVISECYGNWNDSMVNFMKNT